MHALIAPGTVATDATAVGSPSPPRRARPTRRRRGWRAAPTSGGAPRCAGRRTLQEVLECAEHFDALKTLLCPARPRTLPADGEAGARARLDSSSAMLRRAHLHPSLPNRMVKVMLRRKRYEAASKPAASRGTAASAGAEPVIGETVLSLCCKQLVVTEERRDRVGRRSVNVADTTDADDDAAAVQALHTLLLGVQHALLAAPATELRTASRALRDALRGPRRCDQVPSRAAAVADFLRQVGLVEVTETALGRDLEGPRCRSPLAGPSSPAMMQRTCRRAGHATAAMAPLR